MGAAIAEVLAFNGIDVVLKDLDVPLIEKGLARVRQYVDELVRFHAERAEKEVARIRDLGVDLTPPQVTAVQTKLAPKFSRQRGDEVVARVHGTTTW